MAGHLNKVCLLGNLGRDPEIRSTQSGAKIANLSVATSETWKDKSTGEKREKTEWHRVVIFSEALAGIAEKYLKKGSKLYVEGKLQTRKYTDQSGVEKYSTEIVLQNYGGELILLGDPGGSRAGGDDRGDDRGEPTTRQAGDGTTRAPVSDDEIPF